MPGTVRGRTAATTATADSVVVGGGPAGLTAVTYLARFHLSVVIVDDGASRAPWTPVARNVASFPTA